MVGICGHDDQDRRRRFWATQPDAVGTEQSCGEDCGLAGLRLISLDMETEACARCQTNGLPAGPLRLAAALVPKTIQTTDWIRGLALNILLTNARLPNSPCGVRPGAIGGHWSESYLPGGAQFGNLLGAIGPQYRIADAVRLVREYVAMSLHKMVTYGVAREVTVTAEYGGKGMVNVEAVIITVDGTTSNVGLSGSTIDNAWVWQ